MRIDAPKITGSFQIGETTFPDLSSLATTSSINNMMDIVATTGSNTFVGSQTISGSITPAVNDTYDLGSPTHQFRHVYISSGSLYIDGTKVLGSTSQELQITTDVGQSFKVLESGADTITLQSADGNITVATSGGGDVILDPNIGIIALKGTTQVYAGNKILSSDGNNIQFGNGVTVSGSMVVTGYIETQELRTTYISSSILYRSGSTKFGDELTDTHSFTGSLLVSGSVSAVGSDLVSGSSQVNVMSTTNIAQLATTGSNTFTGNQTLSNGQYLRGIRNSGALSINLLGIESGSDRTLMTATGDFVIQNGSLTSMLTLTTSGAPTFANQVIVANGATTGTYGFRHEGAGVWTRMGVPNNSYAYWETNASSGFMIDGALTTTGAATFQGGGNTLTLKKGTGSPAIAFAGTSNEATALLEGVSGGGFRVVNRTGTLSSPTDYQVFTSVNGVATFSYNVKGASYFDAQTSSGFRIRNSNDSANVGGFTRRGLWEGNSNYDPGMWAETGYGLYYYTDGSATIKMQLTTGGNLSIPAGSISASGNITSSGYLGGTSYRGSGGVIGNIASNITGNLGYVLLARLDQDGGWIARGTIVCASWTCWNVTDVYLRKAYGSASVTATVTGVSKGGGQDMAVIDCNYGGARYLALKFTGGNGEIDFNLTGFGLASYLTYVSSITSENATLASY